LNRTRTQNTAILIFASQSARDVVRKRMPQAQQLFDAFTSQTIALVEQTGLPYILHQDQDQKGTSFGAKFTHAVQLVFQQGYSQVITIGNDTPGLAVHHIETALEHLEQGKVTLGPSKDGGFYLMAVSQSAFAKAATPSTNSPGFEHLPWQQSSLLDRLCNQLKEEGSDIKLLEVLEDIDGIKDVRKLLARAEKLEQSIILLMHELLNSAYTLIGIHHFKRQEVDQPVVLNKGSPIAA
jgi:glycosyltransferase A (GT-A) superfamily protein (DUF2064 family)